MRYVASAVVVAALVWFTGIDTGFQMAEAEFATVSITRSTSSEPSASHHVGAGRVTFRNTSVDQLIIDAFGLRDQKIVNAPEWVMTERFDIVATYATHTGGDRTGRLSVPRRLQSLLEQRFALQAEVGPTTVVVKHIERPSDN